MVDRALLSAVLLAEPARFKALEDIVHPMVRLSEREFLKAEAENGTPIAVLEIPLLFETKADALVDATVVVSTTPELQRRRLMKRPGLTPEKIDNLLSRQIPDAEKRRRADFVVDTSGEVAESRATLDAIIAELRTRTGTAYKRYWAA
jgi:dephospho-CoA kinase